MNKKQIICTACPIGCKLNILQNDNNTLNISGNKCPRGKSYAQNEIFDPRRTLTTTIKINNALWNRLPVKSSKPVKKTSLRKIINELQKITVNAPINMGDIIIPHIDNEPDNHIIASRSLEQLPHT